VVLKLTPGLGIPGILLAGFTKVPFRKFFMISLIFNIISALIFCTLGFYSGIAIGTLFKYLKLEEYIVFALIALTVLVYFFIKFIYKKVKNGY